ncbi:MAG: hypothetical protein KME15_27505 [Drouetiella hepatica Uher 2000/2452]|jgi:hypothetical protein|uniref:Uncharacterized protein n=1 Tax=Drouetiella hepatica Uher 2000/2452 TaxID=904376 RepID=A0A951QGW8_9CYAN|nr:hypothetical protein [Drouetiella hepatica Uher 2000/2452]
MPRRANTPSLSSNLQSIAAQALQLSTEDRAELIAILQAYNDAEAEAHLTEVEREQRKEEALNRRGIRGGSGSFEDKIINGYGPYRYLRYWYGRTHKSVYLGKVKE